MVCENLHFSPFLQPSGDTKKAQGFILLGLPSSLLKSKYFFFLSFSAMMNGSMRSGYLGIWASGYLEIWVFPRNSNRLKPREMDEAPADDALEEIELMGRDIVVQRLVAMHGEIAEVNVTVCCDLKGYFYSSAERRRLREEPFEVAENQCYQIGEGDAMPGLELGLRHSKVGETLRIRIASRFAYGEGGRNYDPAAISPGDLSLSNVPVGVIPPNMDLEYEVTVRAHVPDSALCEDMQQRYEALTAGMAEDDEDGRRAILGRLQVLQGLTLRKDAGNRWFHGKDYPRAAKAYSRATKLADSYFNKEKNDKLSLAETLEDKAQAMAEAEQRTVPAADLEVVAVYVTCLNNLVACKLSQGDYLQAKDLCVKVLEMEPRNAKALVRAAKAALALDIFEECEACLRHLQQRTDLEEAQRREVQALGGKLRKARSDYRDKAKQMQSKIAAALFKENKRDKDKEKEEKKEVKEEVEATVTPEEVPSEQQAEGSAPAPAAATVAVAAATAASASPQYANMVFLLATSLAVLLVSLLFAFMYH